MANPIKPKRSYTANSVPLTTDLAQHEMAVNWTDGKIFTKDASNQIVTLTLGGGGSSYTLPQASATVLGGIKVGSGLAISNGTLSVSDSRWDLFLPPAPTSVSGTAGDGQVALTWSAPTVLAQTPITDYVVQYSSNSGSTWTTFSDGTSTSASATVTGLTNGTAYTFRVAAVNGVGTGSYSTASSAVTPGAWTPASLTSLAMWLDASVSSSLYDATSGGSLVSSGGTVRRWQDQSGNGNHVTGSSGPTRSVAAVNSLDALSFSSSTLQNTGLNVNGSNYSLFMVVKFAASGFQISGFGTNGSFGGLMIEANRSSGSHSATFGTSQSSESQASGGSVTNVTKAFGAVLGSGTGTLYINNSSAGTVSRSSIASSSGVSIGSYFGSYAVNGLICEVVYMTATATSSEMTSLQNYFAAKWGV